MPKEKIYLDTTILSAYFDERTPERQRLTIRFWEERIPDFEVFTSIIAMNEINDTPDRDRRSKLKKLARGLSVLPLTDEADDLAQRYVIKGVFAEKFISDATHVSIAVVNRIGYLISWNFQHLVRVKTRREVNLVNSLLGYGPIEIIAPPEL